MEEKPYMKVKKLKEDAKIPSKREEDAGYDIYGVFDEEFKILNPGEIYSTPTGIAVEIPQNWVLYIAERGSTGSRGISKRAGIVDSGFRGEVFILLNNTTQKPIIFAKEEGMKLAEFLQENDLLEEEVIIYPQSKAIAQGLLLYVPHVEVEEVEELDNTSQRKDGAVGSSGK